ncbi:MAG: LPS export ABC transporter periplasmic protein LptC [candidate division Zixibacteria bacterium]
MALSAMVACSRTERQPEEQSAEKIPDSVIQNATIVLTSEGMREAVILADTLIVFDSEDSTVAIGVKVDFYDENGEYRSTLTSNEGLIRQARRQIFVWGEVVVVSDSSRLETESLKWDPVQKLITTDDFVRLHRGSDVVTGYGMESDSRLEHVRILRDVTGSITDIPQSEEELDEIEGDEGGGNLP